MKIILNLALVTFLFLQTSTSQEVNFQELTQIVVGEEYTIEDVQIIQEVAKNNKKKTLLKLLKMKTYLYEMVDINGVEVAKACSKDYIARQKNKDFTEKLYQEILAIKKKHEAVSPSDYQVTELNKKIEKFNALTEEENEAINNFKMCINTHREIGKDYDEIIENLYKAYTIKKANSPIANND